MSDQFEMRARLQQVAAYRELCRGVRRSGRENVFFSLLMLLLTYFAYENGAPILFLVVYGGLALGELLVGVYKSLAPSAEGILLDGIVLLLFVAFNGWAEFVQFRGPRGPSPVVVLLVLLMLAGAIGRFKVYGRLRQLFAERPTAEHMAWFDELEHEIRSSDAESDELVLDLPTGPHWKAKLLGTTVFFVALRGAGVWIAGPEDFELLREKADHGTGRRKALLRIHGVPYPEFQITDATWANYQKWRAANPATPVPEPTS
jgi:hypothetical protein